MRWLPSDHKDIKDIEHDDNADENGQHNDPMTLKALECSRWHNEK